MIEAQELTEPHGGTTVGHSLSSTIAPGTVTGSLGPNGAGGSTTVRTTTGPDQPASGTVTGKPSGSSDTPRTVGTVLARDPNLTIGDRGARCRPGVPPVGRVGLEPTTQGL
ncbi:ATP-binding cassette domain-containing protein [Geodermatophilus telluris]|uniref:ATP-binding cassette domain-containing protein n=1 Tax=Geodermatophilus telluris TaxID=1190417 RepID=UPI000B896232|nr:ATP-binding cassette domain-containing protein [Geodermatophilus telluris]